MTHTVEQVVARHARPGGPAGPDVDPAALPYWVVVVNPRRQPPRPKYVMGFRTESEAEAERARRQGLADAEASAQTARRRRDAASRNADRLKPGSPEYGTPPDADPAPAEPFAFYVVHRPPGGVLREPK